MFLDLLAAGASPITPFFGVLSLVLVMAVVVSLLLTKFRQSVLVGYFLVGVLIANSGLLDLVGTKPDDPAIGLLAELGVILLMFTLGIEFSLGEMRHLWRMSLFGGGLQVLTTGALAGGTAFAFGIPGAESAVIAVAVALSSTAVAMKSFQEIGQPNNPGAKAALGVALFQDILVILFILVLPTLYRGGEGGGLAVGVLWAITKGVFFLVAVLLFGKFVNEPLLDRVARTRSRELFTLTVVALCAVVALAGEALNLSLSLGAFAAGLVVSESMYSHRILSDILPFKDLFLTIFFVSVGLLIDVGALFENWIWVLAGTVLVLTVKGGIVLGAVRLMKLPLRPALLAAASLSSMGEFSLVLLSQAGQLRPIDPTFYQILLGCTAVSMGLVPSLMRATGPIGRWLDARGIGRAAHPPTGHDLGLATDALIDHAVICGYGPVGRSVNEALRRCGVETVVLELNAETVRELKRQKQRVLFADASHPEALDLAGIEHARMIAFTFPAVEYTLAALPLVRDRNPKICVFARAKFPNEVEKLRAQDVEVIHDERESGGAMIRAAMGVYQRATLEDQEVSDILEDTSEVSRGELLRK
jgi:CPA2 family monovalent cation:H+ antiporter-2